MDIKIYGKTDTLSKAETKFALAFFANYIMGPRLAQAIDIEIHFKDQGYNTDGHCYPIDGEDRPREFRFGINPKMKRRKMLECMAHEMVHTKQYARGELSNELVTAKYLGKTYKLTNSFEDYLNAPWEIEAYGRDRALYMFYQIVLKQEKITFKNGKVFSFGKLLKPNKGK